MPLLIENAVALGKLTSSHERYTCYAPAGGFYTHIPTVSIIKRKLQNDCGAAALLQETLLVSPHLLSSGHFLSSSSRPAAVIPDATPPPNVCAHPFPLLSLAACWGLGSLQAWGVSPPAPRPPPHSLVHLLLGRSNEHIISLAPCQRELTRGPRGLLAQTGGLGWGLGGYNHSRVFPSLSSLHPGSSISGVPVSLSASCATLALKRYNFPFQSTQTKGTLSELAHLSCCFQIKKKKNYLRGAETRLSHIGFLPI